MTKETKPVFSAEDFKDCSQEIAPLPGMTFPAVILARAKAAEIANARLAEIAKGWPLATGDTNSDTGWAFFNSKGHNSAGHTHQCRLAFIEPIAKAPCEHEPEITNDQGRFGVIISYAPGQPLCRKCGAKLVAKWSAVE